MNEEVVANIIGVFLVIFLCTSVCGIVYSVLDDNRFTLFIFNMMLVGFVCTIFGFIGSVQIWAKMHNENLLS